MSFHSYTSLNGHEDISKKATDLFKELQGMIDQSRQFNMREQLYSLSMTDYTKISSIQKVQSFITLKKQLPITSTSNPSHQ